MNPIPTTIIGILAAIVGALPIATLSTSAIGAAATLGTAEATGTIRQASEFLRFETAPYRVASGVRAGNPIDDAAERSTPGAEEGSPGALAPRFVTIVHTPGAKLVRVRFADFDLGAASEIHIRSITDGAVQRFTDTTLRDWDGWSAIFNGDVLLVELLVAPGESAHFEIDLVSTDVPPGDPVEGGIASLCGADSRFASADPRVGRLSSATCGNGGGCGGCTAWLTSIGSAITAGHCGSGQGGVIEFNVPQSSSNGSPIAASPDDQYPVGTSWYAFQDGGGGFDWAIMNVGPNSNTGARAHWVQGYFHLSPLIPSEGSTLRLTGYGVDNTPTGSMPQQCCATNEAGNCTHTGCNSSSLTLQTSTGPLLATTANAIFHQVDSEPANSGSPIIRNSNGFAIGVHTHGGCNIPGVENNAGTRLTQAVLSTWLNNFLGPNTRFVDWANVSGTQSGTALNPARTLPTGIEIVPTGGTVALAGGSYTAASGNTGSFSKPVTLTAVSGYVVIGQ